LYGDTKKNEQYSLSLCIKCRILRDIARGMKFLHDELDRLIVHRDLKPGNILIDWNYRARITDFGLSTLGSSKINFAAGTLPYMAPELISQLKNKSKQDIDLKLCDVYSFAIMTYEILSHQKRESPILYEKLTEENCYECIVENKERPNIEDIPKEIQPYTDPIIS